MIGLAEWVKGKKRVSCPFAKKEPEKIGFDITKADKIFDLLLQQGQIKLSQFHTIPFAEELKRMKYCKWYNATSHDTNDCKIFRQQTQSVIEQGRLKFETPTKGEKLMKIDQHPFPTNIVEVSSKGTSSCWHLNQLKIKESLIPRYKQPLSMSKEKGCYLKKKT
jgi:hypothetical protein